LADGRETQSLSLFLLQEADSAEAEEEDAVEEETMSFVDIALVSRQ